MGATGAVMQGAGTGLDLYGQYQAKKANEAINGYNAKVLDLQAVDAIKRGEESVGNVLTAARGLNGTQRAAFAAQGIDLSSDTVNQVANDTQEQAARDVRTARTNAAREAWGLRTQAQSLRTNSKYANRTADFRMAGSALTGTAQTIGMARDYKTKG